jgi:hypothetical protein
MQVLWETTDWVDSTANNVYFMDDSKSKMYAYVVKGTMDICQFRNPIRVDLRGRTFISIPNIWHYVSPEEEAKNTEWLLEGSNGNKYIVKKDGNNYVCSCPGFLYRSKCRHLEQFSK